jgi:hypothetical protein
MMSAPPGARYRNRVANPTTPLIDRKQNLSGASLMPQHVRCCCHFGTSAAITAAVLYTTAENKRENWQKITREIHFVADRKTL